MKGAVTALAFIAVFSTCGCASIPTPPDLPPVNSSDRLTLINSLKGGQVDLTCTEFGCNHEFGRMRKELTQDIHNSDWENLGIRVMQSNYRSDLSYFYLGLAAEGLGSTESAIHYYETAQQISNQQTSGNRCAAGLNNCDGFMVAIDAGDRMKAIQYVSSGQQELDRQYTSAMATANGTCRKAILSYWQRSGVNAYGVKESIDVMDGFRGIVGPFVPGRPTPQAGTNTVSEYKVYVQQVVGPNSRQVFGPFTMDCVIDAGADGKAATLLGVELVRDDTPSPPIWWDH